MKRVHIVPVEHAGYIGRRAKCSLGIVGTVQTVKRFADRLLFKGVTDDGKPWQTVQPTWLD